MFDAFLSSFPSILMIVSPILITAIGGMICERSGVVNIGLEGLMMIGAFVAAALHVILSQSGVGPISAWVSLFVGAMFGVLFSLIHAFASISLNADQTISGTGINLLAMGATIFGSQILFNSDRTKEFQMGLQTDRLGIYPTAYLAIATVIFSWILLYRLPFGMRLRACGEHPNAAESAGIQVKKIQYTAVLMSGFFAGLAGGASVLTQTIQYTSNTINGRGFIALAAVSFGRWTPLGVTGAAFLFGTAQAFVIFANNIPGLKFLPSEIFNLLPYLITLIVLILFSRKKNQAPRALGQPYHKGAS